SKFIPLQISTLTIAHERSIRSVPVSGTTIAAPPAGALIMNVPASPARRGDLAAIGLKVFATRTNAPPSFRRITPRKRQIPARAVTAAPAATPGALNGSVVVAAGQAVHLDISGGTAPRGSLAFAGQQTVRAIALTMFGQPLSDQYVVGTQT